MVIDIPTAEKILGTLMIYHAEMAAGACDLALTEAQRTESMIRADTIRKSAQRIISDIAPTTATADKYFLKLKNAIEANYIKIAAGEWFNG